MTDQKQHRTTERILDILELVSQNSDGLAFTAIANQTDMPKSSLHPIIRSLSQRRYLHFNEDTQRYYMGDRLFSLGQLYANNVNILQLIQTEVNSLSKRVNETSFFGVLSGMEITYLAKGEPDAPIRIVTAYIGTRNPAHSTGLGKALLMHYSKEQLKELLPEELSAKTEHTIISLDSLYDELQKMRPEGFAYEKEESTPGIQCIAIPINYNNSPVAALSISIPIYRFTVSKSKDIKLELKKSKQYIEGLILMYYNQWNQLFTV